MPLLAGQPRFAEGGGLGGSVRTTDGGAKWAEQSTGAYSGYAVDSIACSSVSVCEAGEGTAFAVLHTTNGGTTWVATTTFPPSLGRAPFTGMACPSPRSASASCTPGLGAPSSVRPTAGTYG